jgi:hypothetical protein
MAQQYLTQFVDTAKSEVAAHEVAGFLATQIDFVAGRILAPSGKTPDWTIQALFADCGRGTWLPDGCRRVVVPASILRQFTITAAA